MWNRVGLGVVALVIICFTHWFRKWRNPKCNGVLPPGSMGFPLIGETLSLIIPSYSLDLHPFIKSRLQRYGPIFKTSIVGRPAVVSADPEFNNYIIQQEGKLVEIWYFDAISKLLVLDGESRINAAGIVHKYGKRSILSHIGVESIKERLLPQFEELIKKTLTEWSTQSYVEVKHAIGSMVVNFTAKIMIGYDPEKSRASLSKACKSVAESLMSLPLNIPGTAYNKCLQAEQEAILKRRENPNSSLTWDECKSMTFTQQVINETLRMGNLVPGLSRRTLKDISVKEFTIPAGWSVMLVTSAKQLNPDTFKNPLEFNPWRWKELDPFVISKNFMPFGGGQRQCVGAEYSKSFMVTFFHVLFTNFRWTVTKVGKIARDPILGLGEGIHINVSKKEN
ncbi:hypothetical protein UlMin_032481 [Ulmus minor]